MPAGSIRRALVALAIFAMGTAARAQAPVAPVPPGTARAVGPARPLIAVAVGLPPSVTTSAITMTGLLGSPVPELPANVTMGALSMTGLLGGASARLPVSVTTSPIQMTGVQQTSGRRIP